MPSAESSRRKRRSATATAKATAQPIVCQGVAPTNGITRSRTLVSAGSADVTPGTIQSPCRLAPSTSRDRISPGVIPASVIRSGSFFVPGPVSIPDLVVEGNEIVTDVEGVVVRVDADRQIAVHHQPVESLLSLRRQKVGQALADGGGDVDQPVRLVGRSPRRAAGSDLGSDGEIAVNRVFREPPAQHVFLRR